MAFAFETLHVDGLFAGHNPDNPTSKHILGKLGFRYIGDEFYAPTGMHHPSYMMSPERCASRSALPASRRRRTR